MKLPLLLFLALVMTSCAKAQISKSNTTNAWCQFADPRGSEVSDWTKLPSSSIHVVAASKQKEAMQRLAETSFVQLPHQEVIPYLLEGEDMKQPSIPYLVRAAAYYVTDNFKLPKSAHQDLPFDAFFSPTTRRLSVVNFSLSGQQLLPTNLALLIELPTTIQEANAICSAAR